MKQFNWRLFGSTVFARRYEARMGTREFAKLAGVSAATLNRVENGKQVKLEHALRICDYTLTGLMFFWGQKP